MSQFCCLSQENGAKTKIEIGDHVLDDIISNMNDSDCQGMTSTSTGARESEEVNQDTFTYFSNFDSHSHSNPSKQNRDIKVRPNESQSNSDKSLNRGIVKEDIISMSLRVERQRQLLASSLTNHAHAQAQTAGAESGINTSKATTSTRSQCRILTPSSFDPHIPDNCIRFVCLSDTHSVVEESDYIHSIPYGDVLLHAGDFTDAGEICQLVAFNEFLGKLPHPIKIAVPGNHDVTLDPRGIICNLSRLRKGMNLEKLLDSDERLSPHNYEQVRQKLLGLVSNATILIDAWTTVCGIKIYGYPWLPRHGLPGFGLKNKEDFINKQGFIPSDTDILLTHGPPRGYCDTTRKGETVGCPILKSTVTQRVHPDVVVCGHIHEARGVTTDGSTMFINAAVCDRRYYPVNLPYVFDYTLPPGFTRDDLLQHTTHQQSLPVCWDRQTSWRLFSEDRLFTYDYENWTEGLSLPLDRCFNPLALTDRPFLAGSFTTAAVQQTQFDLSSSLLSPLQALTISPPNSFLTSSPPPNVHLTTCPQPSPNLTVNSLYPYPPVYLYQPFSVFPGFCY